MTNDETMMVLAILKAAYPSSYNNMTKREANGTVMVWAMQFAEMPVDIVLMAVQKLISTNKFPPAVSEVKKKIQSLHWEAYEAMEDSQKHYIPEEEFTQYQRIYELTREYRNLQLVEPNLCQMLSNNQLLQLGAGE